jgi:hypothetical protein
MGFNIKNNYGPNIEVKEGGVVNLHQSMDGKWHTADVEEADYEEIKEDGTLQPAPTEEQRIDNPHERNEELFHFVHPELDETEAWRIHDAVKRVVKLQGIQMICQYLTQLKNEKKALLPPSPSAAYAELLRMGMPDGEGFNETTFRKYYNKPGAPNQK